MQKTAYMLDWLWVLPRHRLAPVTGSGWGRVKS